MRKFSRWFSGLILMLVFVAGVIFSYVNTTPVSINFGQYQFDALPVSLWIIGAFVCGGILGLLVRTGLFREIRLRSEIRRLDKELATARKEIRELRGLPVKEYK